MIVLDEQLLGRGIEHEIARWYRGTVQFITDIRPNTVIKDDAIPILTDYQSTSCSFDQAKRALSSKRLTNLENS